MEVQGAQVLLKNFSSLSIIQFSSYVAPLLILPYLSRTLGVDGFGVVFFGVAFVTICGVLIDFGFDLYAPYKIARHREEVSYINKLSGAIFGAKIFLYLIVALFTVIFAFVSNVYEAKFILLFLFPMFFFSIQPNWLFQSLENTFEIAIYFIVSRFIYIGLVFVLVNTRDDYFMVIICLGACFSINAILSLRKMVKLGYLPVYPSFSAVRSVISESSGYFLARASSSIYGAGGTVFLGLVSTHAQVSYFSSAEQIFRGLQGLFTPVAQALYPYMSRKNDRKTFVLILVASIFVCLVCILVGIFAGELILELVFGADFKPSYIPLMAFLAVLAINVPSTLIGYPFLGAIGHSSYVNMTVITAGIVQLCLMIILYMLDLSSAFYVTLSIVVAELLILLLRSFKVFLVLKQ
jgi:polysaccharide transporter, PST family